MTGWKLRRQGSKKRFSRIFLPNKFGKPISPAKKFSPFLPALPAITHPSAVSKSSPKTDGLPPGRLARKISTRFTPKVFAERNTCATFRRKLSGLLTTRLRQLRVKRYLNIKKGVL